MPKNTNRKRKSSPVVNVVSVCGRGGRMHLAFRYTCECGNLVGPCGTTEGLRRLKCTCGFSIRDSEAASCKSAPGGHTSDIRVDHAEEWNASVRE